jgi:hypothetical protein
VAAETTATRCKYKRDDSQQDGKWVDDVPCTLSSKGDGTFTDVLSEMNTAERPLMQVDRKQLHKCRRGPNGFRRDESRTDGGPCRYGFPFNPHGHDDGTSFDIDSNR